MPTLLQQSQFASDVLEGFSLQYGKKIAPKYFYDDLGSALFEVITLLPEYGLCRADERLLRNHSDEIARRVGAVENVTELGSGTGKKTAYLLRSLSGMGSLRSYWPIDVSAAALSACRNELDSICNVIPVCDDWIHGLKKVAGERTADDRMLLLFLGSSVGNLERHEIIDFATEIRQNLRSGDFFLIGADLVKDRDVMISAYDDPTGVTAAFNLNLLARMNRELGANFDLRSFAHEVRWSDEERRIEMHLLSCRKQTVFIEALERSFDFDSGETIWTESSHKFTESELCEYADASGFRLVDIWVDPEWPFAEALWCAA